MTCDKQLNGRRIDSRYPTGNLLPVFFLLLANCTVSVYQSFARVSWFISIPTRTRVLDSLCKISNIRHLQLYSAILLKKNIVMPPPLIGGH